MHTVWVPPVTSFRHPVYPVAGRWILWFASCLMHKDTGMQMSLTSRPHSLPSCWLGSPGSSSSQFSHYSRLYSCSNTWLPSLCHTHQLFQFNVGYWSHANMHHSSLSSCWHPRCMVTMIYSPQFWLLALRPPCIYMHTENKAPYSEKNSQKLSLW